MGKISINISGGYMPDFSTEEVTEKGGLVRANNTLPISGGYYPIRDKATYNSNAAAGTPIRGVCVQATDGNNYNFLGTSTKLYRFDNSAMSDYTRSVGGAYNATFWDFALYGNWIIATDYESVPQIKKIISDGTNFTALGGTPPNAKYCLIDHGHLIFAYLNYGGVVYPKQIMWSGKELPEGMDTASPTDLATGADSQEFPEMDGVITGLARIGNGWAIFAERSITSASYMGGGFTFTFQINAIKNVGCFFPGSLISVGDRAFFWSRDSMWELSSSGLKEIGQNVKRTVMQSLNLNQTGKIVAWPDMTNSIIHWLYVTTSSTSPDNIFSYNWAEEKATTASITAFTGMQGITGGVVIDSMTAANGYPVINSMNNLIDTYNAGNNLQTIVIDSSDSKAKTLTGDQLTAEFETGEVQDAEAVTMVKKAYIPVEGLTGISVVTPKHRYSLIDAQTSGNTSSIKSDGVADIRVTNRRHAINFTIKDFTKVGKTIHLEVEQSGGR